MRTVINIKADKEVKKNAQKLASELGISLSAVINAYLKQFIRNKAVYYGIAPTMTLELEDAIGRVEKDIDNKKNISHRVSSEKELKNHL